MSNPISRKIAALALGTSFAALAATGAIVMPTAALAQTGNSTVRGKAPAGAEIVATEVNTGAVRRTTAGDNGTYVIAGVVPGNYHITAGDRAADVVVGVASTQVQDFDAPAAAQDNVAVQGDVVVTGTRPTSDIKSSQVNQFVTLHDIAALPQVTRNFLEFADTVPGVQFQVGQNGNTSLRGGAQLASAVNVYIDGVSQKDFIGGGSGITGSAGPQGNGDPGNPFPQLAIAEYKVVTSNYSAEYGDASSSVIIAQTKSGTNQFHGDSFFEYTDQNLRSKYPTETTKNGGPSKQYGVALGGPIIKDIAHFFFTWEHKSLSNTSTVFAGSGVTQAQAVAVLPASVSSQYGTVTNPFTENLYFGKIDIEPTDKDRIEGTVKFRLENALTGGNGQAAASTRAPFANDDRRAELRWQHSEDKFVNELNVSYQNTRSTTTTTGSSPQIQYTYFPNAANNLAPTTLIQVGGPGSGVGRISRQRGFTYKDDLTIPNVQLAGDHTFHAGFSYSSIKLVSQDASSDIGNATYYYAVTPNGVATTPYEVQFPLLSADVKSATAITTDKQYAAYVQDDWTVNSHLTLNLGVRWDHEVVPAYLNYVTPAYVVAAINGPFPGTNQTYASVLAKGGGTTPGYNINDYISTGNNRSARNNFSPRLGFSYDIYGDNRHVIYGGYARAYTRNLFGTLALEQLKIALNGNPEVFFPSPQATDTFGGGCATAANINPDNHCYAFNPAYLTPAGLATLQSSIAPNSHEVDLLHNNIRTPHSDQFSLGMRNKIGDWNTQVTLSYVESFDGIVGRLGNRYADGTYFQNGVPWGAQGVPGAGGLILFDNGAKDRLLQLGVGAQRPYTKESGWSATVAYTLSFADQNNLAGGSNPYQINNNQYLFDLPYASQYPFVRGTAVPEHRLVVTYTRDIFWGISAATKIELATPNYATVIFGCDTVCNAQGGQTLFASRRPNGFLGYRNIDVQVSKDVTFYHSIGGYIRADLLNIFNFKNFDPGSISYPAGNNFAQTYSATPIFNRQGAIVGTPFTVKFSGGLRF